MQQTNTYFGMKPKQIRILGGLAVVACLLFGSMGWLALRGNASATTPDGAPVSQSTATPWIIPSAIPTGTATLLPYETLIPGGWSQFKTGLVEIWLPAQFGPGDPQFFNNSSNTAIGELILTNSSPESSPYRMLVIVSYEPLTGDSLDAYLDAEVAKLSTDFRVAQRSVVTLNGTEAVRFVFETRFNNLEVNDLTYVFLDGGTVWYVEYIAQINEFFELLSTFEKSAQTFRVVR
jgi:hypothetical protein